jgi:hypothetical protein
MKQGGDWPAGARAMSGATSIRGSERRSVTGAWLALLLPLGIGAFFCGWGHMPVFMKPGIPNPIAIIIGLVGLLILGRAVWETIRLNRFGDPVLDLVRVPVPLGGTVEGRITLGSRTTTAPDFNLKLQCIRRVLQQGPKNSHWVETVLWAGEKTVPLLPGAMVPVTMEVPADQPETNADDLAEQILWRLTVRAPFRGPAFLEKYPIPVRGRTEAARDAYGRRAQAAETGTQTGKNVFRATLPILIVGLAIMAGGFYLFGLGWNDLRMASASATWPTVPGQIEISAPPLKQAVFVSRPDADFAYTFRVGGRRYTGHTVYPHLLWRWPKALEINRTYPQASAVTVHYAPGDPAISCLVPGLCLGAGQRLVLGLLVLSG